MNRCVRLFSDRSHYHPEHRNQLADLLRPYWKDSPFSDEQRKLMYELSSQDFQLADELCAADIAVLPMTWNHYLALGVMHRAQGFIQAARRCGRKILSYVSGDEGVTVPDGYEDIYVVRASGLRSRRGERQIAQPVFFEDPLLRYPEYRIPELESPSSRLPAVGFCGQASVNAVKLATDVCRGLVRKGFYHLGFRDEEPQPIYPPALLRATAMRILASSRLVRTQFIQRDRYRGGATNEETREKTSREFYENMAETDFTLCVRGGGNFSKRFYETLAMGRIPALVDTDCCLPFEGQLNWDDYIVRTAEADLTALPQRIADHFTSSKTTPLEARHERNRQFWTEWLTFGGFHRRLGKFILEAP